MMLSLLHFGDQLQMALAGQSAAMEFLGHATLSEGELAFTGVKRANDRKGYWPEDLEALQNDAGFGGFELRRLMPGYGNNIPLVLSS